MPVGEFGAHMGQVGADDVQAAFGEVAQPAGGGRVGCFAEALVELGGCREDVVEGGQDAVVGGGELGQSVRHFLGGGRLADAFGLVSDRGAEREMVRFALAGVERLVAVDAVLDGAQSCHGPDSQTFLLGLIEAGGQPVVVLVHADDGDEAGALKDAVCFRVASAGEDFARVHVALQDQVAVGKGQGQCLLGEFSGIGVRELEAAR
ncbi:hypothetical protein ACIBAG_27570 [Streptomyces sp. NPDC051243]|uniref:hypothetical protein n=1 Tax=Streptomyces sp. NPDC051243 TaxID=3365646 RepID=UPI0037A5C8A1